MFAHTSTAYVTDIPSPAGSIYNYQITMRLFLRDGYVTEALSQPGELHPLKGMM
jgi:hypothetical protein